MLFFFVLTGIFRFSFIIGLVERPLALSLLAGYFTNLWDLAIPLGITVELLWLDVVAMGSIIQPFSGLTFLLLFPICAQLTWTQPGVLLLPLVLSMMAGCLGSYAELRYRIRCNRLLELVPAAPEDTPCTSPERLCLCGLLGRIAWHFVLYLGCYAVICFVVSSLLLFGAYPVLTILDWPFLFAIATIGAVLSLRDRRAYAACGASLMLILLAAGLGLVQL